MKYELKEPKYFIDQTVRFKHHSGNILKGIIKQITTNYGRKRGIGNYQGYHVYGLITPTSTKRLVWIGEDNIKEILTNQTT